MAGTFQFTILSTFYRFCVFTHIVKRFSLGDFAPDLKTVLGIHRLLPPPPDAPKVRGSAK